ncbi:MAG: glycosyltransferase family 4 protein [Patescibacteria group bacterium]|jgi:phosphatidylinositol alpha-1,6-mannosyltransferase
MSHDLLVTQDYPPRLGGVARFYQRLAQFYPVGEMTILAPSDPVAIGFDSSQPYPIIRRRFFWSQRWLWPRWWPLVWQLYRILLKKQVRSIIVGQVLPVGTAVALVTRLFRVPYVVITHGMDIRLPQSRQRKKIAMMKVLRGARFIVANSEYTKSELIKLGLLANRIRVITPGCDKPRLADAAAVQKIRDKYGLTSQAPVLVTVARLEERKGIDTVMKALAHLTSDFPNIKYLIVGTGPDEPRLRQIAKNYALNDRVLFAGAVSDNELPAYYAVASLFVMPARQLDNGDVEGFGIVYLEANSYGRPVIGGRSGGVSEAIVDGVTGILVDPTTSTETIQAIRRLLNNWQECDRMGAAGLQRARDQFSWTDRSRAVAQLMRAIK